MSLRGGVFGWGVAQGGCCIPKGMGGFVNLAEDVCTLVSAESCLFLSKISQVIMHEGQSIKEFRLRKKLWTLIWVKIFWGEELVKGQWLIPLGLPSTPSGHTQGCFHSFCQRRAAFCVGQLANAGKRMPSFQQALEFWYDCWPWCE